MKSRGETVGRTILLCDVHSFSIAMHALGDRLFDFLQEMYDTLGELVARSSRTSVTE